MYVIKYVISLQREKDNIMRHDLKEFDVVVYLNDEVAQAKKQQELERLMNLGIEPSEDSSTDDRIVKYKFDTSKIFEIRQTFVEYRGEHLDAVVAGYTVGNEVLFTPAILMEYNEFLKHI